MVLSIKTGNKEELIDITGLIGSHINIKSGFCIIFCPHTTAGIMLCEGYDPDVKRDVIELLDNLVPRHKAYHHKEGNSPAHIKSILVGSSLIIPVEDSKLSLGAWQKVFFCEFDGPRERSVEIAVFTREK